MDNNYHQLRVIVEKAAPLALPSNTEECHLAILTSCLVAAGVTVQRWTPASEPPKKNGRYLCRYVFNDNYDMTFEQVLTYYATDETPHFQNEGDELGMKVTHWMPLPDEPEEEHTLTIDEVPGPFCSFIMGCDI